MSKSTKELKQLVKEKYSQIALQDKTANASSCCGATNESQEVYRIMSDEYDALAGYEPEADLGLGCGLPTQFAQIQPGDTVIDLGSGAGNDCFVARHETGSEGKVIGIDFSEPMIEKARKHAEMRGFNNVEFRYGDIETMPVSENVADVIVSNCVLNLVPNKAGVLSEIQRVLKAGGHFSISDIVLEGELPQGIQQAAEMYAGCVSGAIQKDDYLALIKKAGFENVQIQKKKVIHVPDDILSNFLSAEEIAAFRASPVGIFSLSVFAQKAGNKEQRVISPQQEEACCPPDSGCC